MCIRDRSTINAASNTQLQYECTRVFNINIAHEAICQIIVWVVIGVERCPLLQDCVYKTSTTALTILHDVRGMDFFVMYIERKWKSYQTVSKASSKRPQGVGGVLASKAATPTKILWLFVILFFSTA